MYDGNPGKIEFGSSQREVRVSEGQGFELSGASTVRLCALVYIKKNSKSVILKNPNLGHHHHIMLIILFDNKINLGDWVNRADRAMLW